MNCTVFDRVSLILSILSFCGFTASGVWMWALYRFKKIPADKLSVVGSLFVMVGGLTAFTVTEFHYTRLLGIIDGIAMLSMFLGAFLYWRGTHITFTEQIKVTERKNRHHRGDS